ncbi:BFD-like [2Fe-2S] binding domain-containing protein [Thermanaeromonas toyohensis ToBE]|uniref:BFD-like [2Fe-2S] binding domain-containing protein n=1 Tax=Thermanaeromonas toyohensis ToBE TaxID=698762 RepID=A0A1W1W0B9_9FIRM|nr:4Fe-4S binding protein [Thermanaeromonas toyohensis]SMB99038.1 BFD-like [2Fe-2S] binding domain-containing protein [Thermanaeromonas toyohensis ToBE]
MKVVNLVAVVDEEKCKACRTCERVCPVLAIKVENRKAVVDKERCRGCAACEQRCPDYAITMAKREEPVVVAVNVDAVDYNQVIELCRRARLHPEQIICYCTATRAEEVAAAILLGARSPEDVSFMTGARTGCKVECIQPILRLLEAAGIKPAPPKGGWQWYGRTPTVWDIPEEVKQKYASRGFYFDEDIKLFERVIAAPLQGRREA